jgi:hypothetical protein
MTALSALCLTGCNGSSAPDQAARTDGDCVARVRFAGVIYRPNNSLNPKAPPGRALGHGALVDCFGKKIGDGIVSRYRVKVFAVRGVAPATAIITGPGDAHGIYVDGRLSRSEWPAGIRRH